MSKIIENPDRLISAFASSFGEDHRETIERAFSRYISDAVIAVTAEDIAKLMIAEYNLRNIDYEQIEDDTAEHFSVLHYLAKNIATDKVVQEIEDDKNLNDGISGQTIHNALHLVYEDEELSAFMISAINNYHLREKNG